MYLTSVLFLALVALAQSADDCKSHFRDYQNCIIDRIQRTDKDIRDQLNKCFSDNKCHKPTINDPDQGCFNSYTNRLWSRTENCIKQQDGTIFFGEAADKSKHTDEQLTQRYMQRTNLAESCGNNGNMDGLRRCMNDLRNYEQTERNQACSDIRTCRNKYPGCPGLFDQYKKRICECGRDAVRNEPRPSCESSPYGRNDWQFYQDIPICQCG